MPAGGRRRAGHRGVAADGRVVAVLTIGEFARASHLSPKALRLYNELGLLTPARVDPVSGYRLYEPGQLEQARLVAWLRRPGRPAARDRGGLRPAPSRRGRRGRRVLGPGRGGPGQPP